MSSTYRVLCLSHDPATIAADGDWNRAHMAEEAITAGIEGHEQCDLLIGRYSYPLVEVGCPASAAKRGPGGCCHASTKWVDVDWLRLLSFAQREPTSTDLRHAADEAARNCWTPERVRRLGPELGVRLHQKAEVPAAVPLTRAAVRTVVLFVGSLVGWIDEVHGDQVDQITDAALAKIGGPAPQQTTDPIDVPEPERARILKQARVHLREYRKTLSTDDDYECGFKAGMLEASWHLTALGRVGDDEFWAAPIPSATAEVIGRVGGGA